MAITMNPQSQSGAKSAASAGGRPMGGSGRWSGIYGVGMLAVFIGERVIGTGSPRAVATVLGLVLVIAAMVVRVVRAQGAADDRARVERTLLGLYLLGFLAVILYFIQSDLPTLRGGKPLEHSYPRLATALAALWPAVWATAAWPIALVELSYATMWRAPRLEVGRIRDALLSGLGLAFALIFAFSVAYVTSERDKKVDLAYFRTTRPGESTRKIVRALDQPVEIALFFAVGSEVREEVESYFTDLSKESNQLKLSVYDFDIDPAKAKSYGVSANGTVVFSRGRKELLSIPPQLESARAALRTLDKEVQQRLLTVIKPKRVTLITQGHEERSLEKGAGESDKRSPIHDLRDLLIDQGHDVRNISASEGLMTDIPKDATLVMVIGPQKPFQPEEIGVLQRFWERGGKLLVALDPESGVDMKELLGPLGIKYHTTMLANDQAFARRTHQDPDRGNLVTANYSSHPTMTTLQRLGMRAPMILPGAGWLEAVPLKSRPAGVTIDAPVKAHYATFADGNGNFQRDPGEEQRAYDLTEAVTQGNARMMVVADSDLLSDAVIRFGGNGTFAIDVVRWLVGDEAFTGAIASEADVPITHTRKQDVVWFYSSIFLVPALVLGVGTLVTRRTRRKGGGARKRPAAGGAPRNQGKMEGAAS
jgi:hypothetical protein